MGNSKAYERLQMLFDDGVFTCVDGNCQPQEVIAAYGKINGRGVYAFSQNTEVNAGAFNRRHCRILLKLYSLAEKTGNPIIGIFDSNGVALQEGFEAFNAYGDVVKASARLSGVVPQVALIAGACIGTAAMIAHLADCVIALKDSDYYLSAPDQTDISVQAQQGAVDFLCSDMAAAVETAGKFLGYLPSNNLSPVPSFETETAGADGSALSALLDADSMLEMKAGYAPEVTATFGTLAGKTVGVLAFNGDAVTVASAYKAEAFIQLCDAYHLPLITLADAQGFQRDNEAQMLIAATKLMSAYAAATCPKISLITKAAIGGALITLAGKGANADITLAYETALAAPMEAARAVAFLYNKELAAGASREELEAAYQAQSKAEYAAACGAIDDVFPPAQAREKLIAAVEMLAGKRETTIPRKHTVK